MADAQEVALSDEEVFGPEEKPEPPRTALSDEEVFGESDRAKTLEGVGSAVKRIEEVAASIVGERADVTAVIRGISSASRALESVRDAVARPADGVDLSPVAAAIGRMVDAIERSNARVIAAIEASNERLAAAVAKIKVEAPAPPPEKPREWHFDVKCGDDGAIKSVTAVAVDGKTPRTALEAAKAARS